jgi:glycosyltransferase involved in cell wall biosynthesis
MKLLIVTETESIHAARWVNQLKETGWEVHVFQSIARESLIHSEFGFGTFHIPSPYQRPEGLPTRFTLPQAPALTEGLTKLESKYPGVTQSLHERYLENFLRQERPDVVHSLGLNINWTNICLPVLRVKKSMGDEFPCPWLYSTWGTDLTFYAGLSEKNLAEVRSVLQTCDYLITEHSHDHKKAQELGFKGTFAGCFTGFGGIEGAPPMADPVPVSKRKTIFLKGRDEAAGDPVGRAMTALRAFRLCEEALKDYRIVVASASTSAFIKEEIAMLEATTDLRLQVLPYVSSEHLMECYGASRVFISLTVNDGIPRSLLEAMAHGAFPILGRLDSLADLVKSGENGLLVSPEDPEAVADALRKAISDNKMVDSAHQKNREIIERDFSDGALKPRVFQMYRDVAGGVRRPGKKTGAVESLNAQATTMAEPADQRRTGHGEAVIALIAKAASDGSGELVELVRYAAVLDNKETWQRLADGVSRNDSKVLRQIRKAARRGAARASVLGLFGSACGRALRLARVRAWGKAAE